MNPSGSGFGGFSFGASPSFGAVSSSAGTYLFLAQNPLTFCEIDDYFNVQC